MRSGQSGIARRGRGTGSILVRDLCAELVVRDVLRADAENVVSEDVS